MNDSSLQLWPVMRRIERAAWMTIRTCMQAKRLAALPLPIPVEQWIEAPLGIRFSIEDLSKLGPNVLGAARVNSREILVSDTITDQEGRFRFTAAHELGHIVLHSKLTGVFRDSDDDSDYVERRIEREADRFAASFLMPIPALCATLSSEAAKGQDAESLLEGVRQGDSAAQEVFRTQVLPRLARRFQVSTSALVHRFADVQLPSGEEAIPYEIGLRLLPTEHLKEALRRR